MTDSTVIELLQRSMLLTLILGGPLLLVALVVGVAISLLQAITQIQDMTLTFIPKILAISLTLLLLGGWMLQYAANFTQDLFLSFPGFLR